jgi:hypothetical protein
LCWSIRKAVDINQHGLTGSWYNPAAAGQGVEIELYQDAIAPGVGYLQGSWATFSVGWETGQRWYTFGGTVQRGQPGATFTLFENVGGKFNAPPATQSTPIGTVVLTFLDCSTASMKYQDVLWDRYWGPFSQTMPLVRLTTVGTATATFFSCETAQLSFNFTAGSNAGASGTVHLSRVGPAPPGCGS